MLTFYLIRDFSARFGQNINCFIKKEQTYIWDQWDLLWSFPDATLNKSGSPPINVNFRSRLYSLHGSEYNISKGYCTFLRYYGSSAIDHALLSSSL